MTRTRRGLDAWLDDLDATDLRHGLRLSAAHNLRGLAHRIWCRWRLDEIRYISETDAVVIRAVSLLDRTANRLDPPY